LKAANYIANKNKVLKIKNVRTYSIKLNSIEFISRSHQLKHHKTHNNKNS